jgi:hypothetical protein
MRTIKSLLWGGLFALFSWQAAQAQPYPNTWYAMTNNPTWPVLMTANSVSNLTSQPVQVRPDRGIGIQIMHNGHASGTNAIGLFCDVSVDGTNWTTHAPLLANSPVKAAAPHRYWTNFPAVLTEGARFFRITSVSNGNGNDLYITNLWVTRAVR